MTKTKSTHRTPKARIGMHVDPPAEDETLIPIQLNGLHLKSHERGRAALRQAINMVRGYLLECKELYPSHYPDPITADTLGDEDIELITSIANAIYSAHLERAW